MSLYRIALELAQRDAIVFVNNYTTIKWREQTAEQKKRIVKAVYLNHKEDYDKAAELLAPKLKSIAELNDFLF